MPKPTLHLICQAHLDPVWLWPVADGAAEALCTIDSAVNRLRENPTMKFTRSSAQVYHWIEETDPRLFAEIKRLVKAGRWETIGGWIEQPDCNLPSAESIVRHSLYGGAYFTSRFGEKHRPRIGYNVDSFGHAAGFPQLLVQAGFDTYVFMRPQAWEAPSVPNLFWWQSPDGSRVLTQRVPGEYGQQPKATADDLENNLRENWQKHFSPGFNDGVFRLGIGNHGGGPTKEHLARIAELQKNKAFPVRLKFSTVAEYLSAVRASPAFGALPVHEGELQHHARGCYAAWSEIKRLNRKGERTLQAAETAAHCAGLEANLEPAWWALLFNQFHDILAGTSTAQTGAETRDRFGAALHAGAETLRTAVHSMARRVDSSHLSGNTLFAFNPLPWAREVEVTLDTFMQPHGREWVTHLTTPEGCHLPIQWIAADANFGPHLMPWGKLCARVTLPAAGYTAFHLGLSQLREQLQASTPTLSTVPAPKNPVRFVALPDTSDTWAHGIRQFKGKPERIPLGRAKVIEQGMWQTVVRHALQWRKSTLILDVVARANEPALELRLRVNWQEPREILRLEWPTGLGKGEWVSQVCGGRASRLPDGDEESAQNWTAFADENSEALLVNDGTGSSVSAKAGVLRVIVARSVPYAAHDPVPVSDEPFTRYLDQGWQEHRFFAVRLQGESPLDTADRLASSLLTGAEAMIDSCHPGDAPLARSFFSLEPSTVNALCLKKAERSEDWIVRLQNPCAVPFAASVKVGESNAVAIPLRVRQIATYAITPLAKGKSDPQIHPVDIHEQATL